MKPPSSFPLIQHTVVLVTRDVERARRVTDWVDCLCVRDGAGELTETVCCDAMLEDPDCFYEFST